MHNVLVRAQRAFATQVLPTALGPLRVGGSPLHQTDSFSDFAGPVERASPTEIRSDFDFARILLAQHFRLFQHNRSQAEVPAEDVNVRFALESRLV